MIKIGFIKSILNNEFLLVESESDLDEGEQLVVYAILESEDIKKKTGLDFLAIPKGELIVKNMQARNIYLVATAIFETKKRVSLESPFSNSLGSSLAASLSGIGLKQVETTVNVQKTTPVAVNQEENLKINYKKEVSIGDAVSKKVSF
jgi:hypothetical protein